MKTEYNIEPEDPYLQLTIYTWEEKTEKNRILICFLEEVFYNTLRIFYQKGESECSQI